MTQIDDFLVFRRDKFLNRGVYLRKMTNPEDNNKSYKDVKKKEFFSEEPSRRSEPKRRMNSEGNTEE